MWNGLVLRQPPLHARCCWHPVPGDTRWSSVFALGKIYSPPWCKPLTWKLPSKLCICGGLQNCCIHIRGELQKKPAIKDSESQRWVLFLCCCLNSNKQIWEIPATINFEMQSPNSWQWPFWAQWCLLPLPFPFDLINNVSAHATVLWNEGSIFEVTWNQALSSDNCI